MNILNLYAYIWVTIFVCLSAGPVPQRHRRISYGLKLQNKPRRNAIKTTPITTTTTTTTTTATLMAQNTSFQSIDDYLNYDYDYLHYFYDLDYEDVTAVEVKNKQSNGEIPSESLNLKEEVPSEPLNFKGEIPSEPLSFNKDIPIEPLSFNGEIPSESLSFKKEIPIEPLSFKGKIPSEPLSFKGKITSESMSFKKEIPIEPLSFKGEIPSESLSLKGEIPSEPLGFKGQIPSEPLNFKGEIQSEPLSFTGEIPSESPSFKEEFSSQVEKAKGESFASEPRIIKEEILSEATKLKSSSSIDILKEIKTSRRNVTKHVRALSGKSESERKTLHEEAIPASQERYSVLDEMKSLPVDGKPFNEEDPLTARQNDLLEKKKRGSEEKKYLREGDQVESSPEGKNKLQEENTSLLAESDVLLPLELEISYEKILKRKAIKIEKDDKSINKINIIVRKPIISNVEAKKTELNDSKILSNSTVNGREGRFLDHDSVLQKIKRLPSKESESSNFKNETVLEAASNGIKQLRYTTQQPDMIKSAPKASLNRLLEKQTNSSDQSPKDIVKVVSDKTVSVDLPIGGQNFVNNNSKLGWRSESSVSVEVSVESSRARGKEISSTQFHKRIVNSPERAQESMQLKEHLSLEVSATPKITDILPTVKPGAKTSKRPLITLEPITESEIITMKPIMATSTTENTITTPEDKPTNTLTSAFPANLDSSTSISPVLVISQYGSDSSIHKVSSNKRSSSDSIDPTHTSSFPLTTTSKSTSTPPPILLTSETLKNENKTMKHSIHDQIDTTASMAVTQATMASETSNEKKSFGTEEPTTTSRINGLPKKRQSRPFRRNLSLNSRKLVIPVNLVPPHLISQLGMNPHGIHPSGVNPFGMQPQGITPFGISPKGVDPLGLRRQMLNVTNNSTLVNSPTTNVTNETNTELKPDPLAEERVHVQVTKPDGSINGDYLVLDHNTGSLSGVRYEAIDGADQALIQKALLSFLSLDPRLDPRPKDINGENLPEISELADAVQPSSDPSTNTEPTISVKLKPQITDQT